MAGDWADHEGQTCTVTLEMGASTVAALDDAGSKLYLMKAVRCDQGGGYPLVWALTTRFSTRATLCWTEEYYAYAATEVASLTATLRGAGAQRISLGQTLVVGRNAVPELDPDHGIPGTVVITNPTTSPLSCGLSQRAPLSGSTPAPVCVFPLHGGGNLDLIIPLPRIVLMFATVPLPPGSAVPHVYGPTVLVDLARANPANLRYDIDKGWSGGGTAADLVGWGELAERLVLPTRSPPVGDRLSACL
ncbi:hypothetical protein ACIHCQ_43215 [Streptomyces sp. NPDC052236]|uniref:hypothetical protein n=1 Tax=Streptomyces sp. NPDC052236 TaxID=3365686 RepID=UPI0037D83C57